jgi:hypothetical protein
MSSLLITVLSLVFVTGGFFAWKSLSATSLQAWSPNKKALLVAGVLLVGGPVLFVSAPLATLILTLGLGMAMALGSWPLILVALVAIGGATFLANFASAWGFKPSVAGARAAVQDKGKSNELELPNPEEVN